LQAINEEETLLEFEVSPFKLLKTMLAAVEPFDRLWHIVLDFHLSYDKWYYGELNS
jgi:dynein heavy chain